MQLRFWRAGDDRAGRRAVTAALVASVLVAAGTATYIVDRASTPAQASTATRLPRLDTSSPTSAPSASVAGRPNIVFVLADDLSRDLVRYMPHVQWMQQRGVSLANYFVVDSLCCPSRTSLLTGRYPHNDGVFTNEGYDGGYDGFNEHGNVRRTWALALQRAGYRTGLLGKYLNNYQPVDGVPRGWNEWDVAGDGYHEYNYWLNENGSVRWHGDAPRDYLTDVLSRKASAFITRNADAGRPFALEIAPFAPHLPAVPAPRDANLFSAKRAPRGGAWDRLPDHAPAWLAGFPKLRLHDRRRIDAIYRNRLRSIQAIDRMLGHLEDVLQRAGVADNTYVVFSSDNGYHLGQYRLLQGKQTAFDTDIRVPLVVTGPAVPAGRTVHAIAPSIDIAPTFAAIGGTVLPSQPDGRNMVRLWHGRVPTTWPSAVLIEHHRHLFAATDPDAQPLRSAIPPSYEAIRTAHALYVEYADGEREYYDLRTDPDELDNLIRTVPAGVLRPIRKALHALQQCVGAASCAAAARTG
jgi:N-acetylglucosamine-6-sulfatase